MPETYEDLVGSLGKAMFFRPERRRVRDLLSRSARLTASVNGVEYPVHDVSINGVSVLSTDEPSHWSIGSSAALELRLNGIEMHRSRVVVARVEPGARGLRVGLGLTTGFLDLTEIEHRYEDLRLERELGLGPDGIAGRLPRPYVEAVARAVLFVSYYRSALRRQEERLKARGSSARAVIDDLLVQSYERLEPRWTEIRLEAAAAAEPMQSDPELLLEAKDYTESVLSHLFLECPAFRRAYLKPLGYPGDFEVMRYCYADRFEGDSVFAKVFHRIWVNLPLPGGVLTRNDLLVDLALQEHERLIEHEGANGGGPSFRVLSLGSGPAREVSAFVARRPEWPGRVSWLLVDQDEEALSLAYHTGHRAIRDSGQEGGVRCLHLSFAQLLSQPALATLAEPQHFIMSAGLFDYLRTSVGQMLVAGLYDRLAQGGLLAIGNAIAPNDDFWSPEIVTDWTLLYRTREQMLELAARLPESAELDVVMEPRKAYYLLLVRKR